MFRNVSFKPTATDAHHVAKASNMSECTSIVCNYGLGDYAYLFDDGCFAVTCGIDHSQCNPNSHPGSNSAAVRIYWTGTKANEMLTLKYRPESSILRVKVKRQFSTVTPGVLRQT